MRISDWSSDVCSSDLYEGVVIGKRNRGLNSSFIVRKISSGEAVERTFQLYSPQIASIEVKRRGDVRRAKLRSEEHTSELQSLMRISYAVFCLKQQKKYKNNITI